MGTIPDNRKSKRFEHKSTVMLENENNGYFSYGQMINYSSGGMCIGSEAIYNRGVKLKILFGKPVYKAAPSIYFGTVRWCKEQTRDYSECSYGIGIKCD